MPGTPPCSSAPRWSAAPLALAALLPACRATGEAAEVFPPPLVEHAPRVRAYDVEHYSLELALDPGTRTLDGRCTVRLFALDVPLERVELDLVGLEVRAVRDGDGRPLVHTHEGGVLVASLAVPAPPQSLVQLSIDYGGRPAKGLYFVGGGDEPTHLFTQGECEDSRYWFPCWDAPGDRATSELRVALPAGWTSVAAGELVDVVETPTSSTQHWRMTTPHPVYLTTLVAGELAQSEAEWDEVPLLALSEPQYADWMGASFAETGRVLEVLSELSGVRYPYRKYAQACVESFPFGGMENVSATTLTNRTLGDERKTRDAPSLGLVVHEAAHQWYGDLLTCADWSHAWLNEGFATYATLLYAERTRGRDEFLASLRDTQDSYVRHAQGDARQAVVSARYRAPIDLFDGDVYAGGAVRLHLLRTLLGDEVFFAGLREYTRANANGLVTTDDLRAALEGAAGRDLSEFFEQWFHSPGYPELRASWSFDARRSRVRLVVEQRQEPIGGTPAAFRFPVDVEVADAFGTQLHRIEVTARRQTFELQSSGPPRWVRFDAGSAVPLRLVEAHSDEQLLAIAADCESVNGRRDAAHALGERSRRLPRAASERAAEVLGALVVLDPSPWVRADAAVALANFPEQAGGWALRAAAESDPESRVRVAALAALRAFGPSEEQALFARAQFEAAWSWDVMAAAAALYATAAPGDSWRFLEDALAIESPFDRLRAKLLGTIGELQGDAARELLRSVVADPAASPDARRAAVEALGGRPDLRTEERDALLPLLESPEFRLRVATIGALGRIGDPAARSALAARHAASIFPRERRAIERALSGEAGA